MSEEKTMQEEAQDEMMELALENLDKLIPEEWRDRINNVILPKLLYFTKMMVKKSIKQSADLVGKDKFVILCNMPVQLKDEVVLVPHYFKIDKSQLKNELVLKDGEDPETQISYLDIYAKIDSYTDIKQIIADAKNGNLLRDVVSGKDYPKVQDSEQKQIDTSANNDSNGTN